MSDTDPFDSTNQRDRRQSSTDSDPFQQAADELRGSDSGDEQSDSKPTRSEILDNLGITEDELEAAESRVSAATSDEVRTTYHGVHLHQHVKERPQNVFATEDDVNDWVVTDLGGDGVTLKTPVTFDDEKVVTYDAFEQRFDALTVGDTPVFAY